MEDKTQKKNHRDGRREYLVTFAPSMLGKALLTLTDLGVRREIRCYPERRVLLLGEELEALYERGIVEEQAIPLA